MTRDPEKSTIPRILLRYDENMTERYRFEPVLFPGSKPGQRMILLG